MDNRALVERIIKNLDFDLETVPKARTSDDTTTTSKADSLNLKIRVRKKEVLNEPQNQGFISNNLSEPELVLQKIRLVNSDETIISFDMFMEAENEKKTARKPRKHIFDKLKPGLCLGAADDDDEQPYMPTSGSRGHSNENNLPNKSDGKLKQPFTLAKNTYETFGDSPVIKREKHFLGRKCKPGGCLDPPFGEDRYAYKPCEKEPKHESKNLEPIKVIKQMDQIVKPDIKLPKKKKSKSKDLSIKSENDKIKESHSHLSLNKTESLQNSLITYPPDNDIKIPKTKAASDSDDNRTCRSKPSSIDKSRQSINDSMNSFFSLPKGTIRESNTSAQQEPSKRHSYNPKTIKNKPVEYVKNPVPIAVSLDSVPLKQNATESIDDMNLPQDILPICNQPASDSNDVQQKPMTPFILPLPVTNLFPFKSNEPEKRVSPVNIEQIDSSLTTTHEIPIESIDPTYSSLYKIGLQKYNSGLVISDQSFDKISIKDIETNQTEESPEIINEIIDKNYDKPVEAISKVNSKSQVEKHLLKRLERNNSNAIQNEPENIRTLIEDEKHDIITTPDINQQENEQIENKKHIIEEIMPDKKPPEPDIIPDIKTHIKPHVSQSVTKVKSHEIENLNTENIPISVTITPTERSDVINVSDSIIKSMGSNTEETVEITPTLDDKKYIFPTDQIIKQENIDKLPSIESNHSINVDTDTLPDIKPDDMISIKNNLNENYNAQDPLSINIVKEPTKQIDEHDQDIHPLNKVKKDDYFPKNIDIEHERESAISSTTSKSEDRDVSENILKVKTEIVPVNSNTIDILPVAFKPDETYDKNNRNISPGRDSLLDKGKTSSDRELNKDKIIISLDRDSSIDKRRISPDNTSLKDKSRNSPDNTSLIDKSRNSPDKCSLTDARRISTDRGYLLDKSRISPDRGSLIDARRISLDRGSMIDKSKILPDKRSLIDARRISPVRGSMEKRKISPGRGSLIDARIISPDRDSLIEKRKVSPDRSTLIDKRRSSPDRGSKKENTKASPDRGPTKFNRRVSPVGGRTLLHKPVKKVDANKALKENLLSSIDSTCSALVTSDLSTVSLDLAFHSYVNSRNERILSTVDVKNKIKRYPNDSIIMIKSQIKLNSKEDINEFSIPIDPNLDMGIDFKKTNESNEIFKTETQPIPKTAVTDGRSQSSSVKTKGLNQKVQIKLKENDTMSNTLSNIYEQELVPLQSIIRDLKQEIDTLTAQQIGFKKKMICQKKAKPRLNFLNKTST